MNQEDSKEEKEKINNDITMSENTLDDSHEKLSNHEGGQNSGQEEERAEEKTLIQKLTLILQKLETDKKSGNIFNTALKSILKDHL